MEILTLLLILSSRFLVVLCLNMYYYFVKFIRKQQSFLAFSIGFRNSKKHLERRIMKNKTEVNQNNKNIIWITGGTDELRTTQVELM